MKTLLATLVLISAAAAGPMFEDPRAGVAFPTPDGWTEVPTPPVPDDSEPSDSPLTPLVRFQASRPAPDGTLARLDVFLVRARSLEDAQTAFEDAMKETWRGFDVTDRRDLGGAKSLAATVDGGKAFGAVLQDGKRFAAMLLAGGADTTDAPVIAATGTWAWSRPDPDAPLRIPPGWKVRETQHYRIRYSGGDDDAAEVGRHLEAISVELRRLLPLEIPGTARRAFDVRLFQNEREFEAYAALNGVQGAEAYFSPAQRELVAHMDERSREHTFHVLYHEATHQYLRDALGKGVRIPIWLDEGLGEVFYPGTFGAGGRFVLKENSGRREVARDAVADGTAPTLEKLLAMKRDDLYALESGYAIGWSVTHFLMNDPRYRGSVVAYLEALRETKDDAKAREKAWTTFTIEQLERDWKKWVVEE